MEHGNLDNPAQEVGQESTIPSISTPKGGGAIRGIGEKFGANPVTGTGSMSIPIAASPGRSGFGPQLDLTYDSGSGNGPFGFGWRFSQPSISRKTDKGLPRYRDSEDSDTFLLSGAEDLVPLLFDDGQRFEDTITDPGYVIHRYRPRTEGQFARIERWRRRSDGDVHWRSYSNDNILTLYGLDASSRIVDPENGERIFKWLISETRDRLGNAIIYRYKREDGAGIDTSLASERYRGPIDDPRRATNRYPKRIFYGNRTPLLNAAGARPAFLTQAEIDGALWMFELVFDYGEHADVAPSSAEASPWAMRADPFSSYRSGFEVRTLRLCHRVLMFHHFPDEPAVGNDCLVKATEFEITPSPTVEDSPRASYSFLRHFTLTSFIRDNGGYRSRSLPQVEFEYSQPVIHDEVEEVPPESLNNLPDGIDGTTFVWTDLHGEGTPGIFSEQGDGWFYKRNLSPASEQPVKFAGIEAVTEKPNARLAEGGRFMDLAGDGSLDLVLFDAPTPGLYEHDAGEGWKPFRAFTKGLNRDAGGDNLRFIDLDGDGHADILITEEDAFVWHRCLGESGYGPAVKVCQSLDEEAGPRLVFADGTQSIYLADFSGDGLTDLVRIRNGEVCYWPNLGHGRFGSKVQMEHSPHFDTPDQFSQNRLRIADIDGSGTSDLIYLHRDGVRLYFNQSGNSWTDARLLDVFPRVDEITHIIPTDLLGNGTACLVWSSPLPGDQTRSMRYVRLMGAQKPHLLTRTINNLGSETRIHYVPSTKFYLQDKLAGKPWITRLPFPIHVVERIETFDHISRNRFATRFAYHHGHFDGEEREFRGFGMVEQWDTEAYDILAAGDNLWTDGSANINDSTHVPPVLTKTWFHTGAYLGRGHISDFFAGLGEEDSAGEYFREPGHGTEEAAALLLPDSLLPEGLTFEEEREACRALKGSVLRREIYAQDGSDEAAHPYEILEQNFTIRVLQNRHANRHAVFLTHARESLSYHYERALVPVINERIVDAATADANPAQTRWLPDPRVQHSLTLEVDLYGNVLRQIAIGYGRRYPDDRLPTATDREAQQKTYLTYTEAEFTNAIDDNATHPLEYLSPLPSEVRVFELTGVAPAFPNPRFGFDEWVAQDFDLIESAAAISFEEAPHPTIPQKRLLDRTRSIYRKQDLSGPLPFRKIDPLALPWETYQLALTPGIVGLSLRRDGQPLLANPATILGGFGEDEGGYVDLNNDDHWWVPSGRIFFSPGITDTAEVELAHARQHFFLPHRSRDPFGAESVVTYDSDSSTPTRNNNLLPVSTRDAIGNVVTVDTKDDNGQSAIRNDYRLLQPYWITDENGNRTQVAFDIMGMVAGTAVMGRAGENLGDSLKAFDTDLEEDAVAAYLDHPNPRSLAPALLAQASTRLIYDLHRFQRTRQQNPEQPDLWQPAMTSTIVREIHVSDEVAPTSADNVQIGFICSDGFGREIQQKAQAEPGPVIEGGPPITPRWTCSGWTIFNNKGKPVRQYEPFFSATHLFEYGNKVGVSPTLFYDPLERVVATLHPNHTYEKVVFDPWQETTWDVNDTVLIDDPAQDTDVGYFFKQLPTDAYLPTWHADRISGQRGPEEQDAATKASAHADTPTTEHFDSLARSFLSVGKNRVVCSGHDLDGDEENLHTRVDLDIEGNQLAVYDSLRTYQDLSGNAVTDDGGRLVMRYAFDLLGNRLYQANMDAGERWSLSDIAGNRIRSWDSRGHDFRNTYDVLRRPSRSYARGTSTFGDNDERLTEILIHGEQHPQAESRNLRGRLFLHLDQAGAQATERGDFKGNPLSTTRRFAREYRNAIDWTTVNAVVPTDAATPLDLGNLETALTPLLENITETYTSLVTYDALNRPLTQTTPHTPAMQANVIRPSYNEANLLERIDVNLRGEISAGAPVWTPFVTDINYDAKGQRQSIDYAMANGKRIRTNYRYDPETFRLVQLYTRRGVNPASGESIGFDTDSDHSNPPPATSAAPIDPPSDRASGLQNITYTYDPVGNITRRQDRAQQSVYFNNQIVESGGDYTYDAVYRLIEGRGREHLGQAGGTPIPHSAEDEDRSGPWQPGDGQAMGRYVERYVFDAVGNILKMQHRGLSPAAPGWTRHYDYGEESLLSANQPCNRLTGTRTGNQVQSNRYRYDAHGNMTRMPHLGGNDPDANLHWNHQDQLQRSELNGGGTLYSVYDNSGQRVRKVWEKAPGLTEERLYFGSFEIFRRRGAGGNLKLERETLHIMDGEKRAALVESRTLDVDDIDDAPAQLIRYQLADHLGSSVAELDANGAVLSLEEYSPFGNTVYQGSLAKVPKRYRYTGKERDEATGLYYHGARYYAPWLGRWTACDPLDLKDSTNVYLYALNNPIVAKDPTGGPAWLIPVAIYLGYKALTSAGETAVEAGIASATGDKEFSVVGTFTKNMVVNSTIGLVPGTSEAKIGVKAAVYTGKLAIRATADATLDTAQGKGDFTDNLAKSGVSNLIGDGGGALLSKGFGKVTNALSDKAAKETTEATTQALSKDAMEATTQAISKDATEATTQAISKDAAENVAKAAPLTGGLLRRTSNLGDFSDLPVTMNLKTVKQYARSGGIGIKGVRVKIIRDASLMGKGVFGFAHSNRKQIDLYPDAFTSPENLIRTLGHERTHIMQFQVYGGPAPDSAVGKSWEEAAFGIEDSFVQFWKTGGSK